MKVAPHQDLKNVGIIRKFLNLQNLQNLKEVAAELGSLMLLWMTPILLHKTQKSRF